MHDSHDWPLALAFTTICLALLLDPTGPGDPTAQGLHVLVTLLALASSTQHLRHHPPERVPLWLLHYLSTLAFLLASLAIPTIPEANSRIAIIILTGTIAATIATGLPHHLPPYHDPPVHRPG